MKIISWNVNGIRSAAKKGLIEWINSGQPDILCLQETKAEPGQLEKAIREIPGYSSYFSSAEKKGYSGVALYTKTLPVTVGFGMGVPRFDSEGRMIIAEYDEFFIFNVYFPNGKQSQERLDYKMEFYDAFLETMKSYLAIGKGIIVCGDVNTAHTEIDLARPRENEKVSGFLPMERAWIDKFLATGFVDTFRIFNSSGGNYTWWDLKSGARARNVGWRIDYFFSDKAFSSKIKNAFILRDVMGSDHCPIGIEVE
ncbi:MAG TPA: exodeoxyribonuclease III [Desulfomonilia bacterium]